MSEKQIEAAFTGFDKAKKGHLTFAEYRAYEEYLGAVLKVSDSLLSVLRHFAATMEKITKEDVKRILFIQPAFEYMQRYSQPGAKVIGLLKQLATLPDADEEVKSCINSSIEQIISGKLYQTELDSSDMKGSRTDMLPWLENFSTPSINPEIILSYTKARKKFKPRKIDMGRKRKGLDTAARLQEVRIIEENGPLMATIDSPGFDIFSFEKTFGRERTTPLIAYQVMRAHKAFSKIDEAAFTEFVTKIRKGYEDNDYHNDLHAADVLQMCHYMLLNGLQETAQLDALDVAALLISAIIHDFRHPGVNNGYLTNSQNELALVYNDQSVLENFHVSQAYRLVWRDPDCAIFKNLTKEETKIIRKRITQCVISTDNAKHFEYFALLQNLIAGFDIRAGKNSEKIINTSSPVTEFESKQQILNVCLHAADISNPARPFPVAFEFAKRVMEEFYSQGDTEKSKGLPVSFLCDRMTTNMPAAQVGFVSGIVRPYFAKLAEIFPGFQPLFDNVKFVEEEWRRLNALTGRGAK